MNLNFAREQQTSMPAWLKAALGYFAVIFALGFVLGTIRTLVLLPRLGEFAAVLLELPVMLAASWWASRRLAAAWQVPARPKPRLAMGCGALALLMGAEWLLAVLVLGLDTGQWLGRFATPAGALGLSGQIVFGMIPALQIYRPAPRRAGT